MDKYKEITLQYTYLAERMHRHAVAKTAREILPNGDKVYMTRIYVYQAVTNNYTYELIRATNSNRSGSKTHAVRVAKAIGFNVRGAKGGSL